MIRRLGMAIGLAVCTCGAGSIAVADCALIDRLDKLQIIQARLARDPDTALFANDIRQLRTISTGLSHRAVIDAVDGNRFTGHGADVARFLQETQRLLQRSSLDDPQSIQGHFNTQIRDNLRRIGAQLTNLRCNDTQIAIAAQIAAERGAGGSSDAEDLAEVVETLNQVAEEVFQLRTLFILILLAGATSVMLPMIRHRLLVLRRQAKRHNITYATSYKLNDREIKGMLIDINCHGTKLKHEADQPLPRGTSVTIAIAGQWTDGIVRWSNTHYSGVRFRQMIPLSEVDAICALEEATETQNGAPRGAA